MAMAAAADFEEVFELERVAEAVREAGYERVALQFPDDIVGDSVRVAEAMSARVSTCQFFVLADNTFASTDPDEIAAEHVKAQAIVLYGRASLNASCRLPVIFVFGRRPVDVAAAASAFRGFLDNDRSIARVLVLFDVIYAHSIAELESRLRAELSARLDADLHLVVSTVALAWSGGDGASDDAGAENSVMQLSGSHDPWHPQRKGRRWTLPDGDTIDDYVVFYLGGESATLTHLMLTLNKCRFYSFDPATGTARQETLDVNRALMRRYYLMQRARDAEVIGIIVASLSIQGYLQVAEYLRRLVKRSNRKAYMCVMGKLNTAKLANFMEVDVFVLVASPENSIIESKEFLKPVVTPYELELALTPGREWTGSYKVDLADVLPGLVAAVERPDGIDDEYEAYQSLVSNSVKSFKQRVEERPDAAGGKVVVRDATSSVVSWSPAGDFLAARHFQGLEPRLGETPVTKAIEGRTGVARGYDAEPTE